MRLQGFHTHTCVCFLWALWLFLTSWDLSPDHENQFVLVCQKENFSTEDPFPGKEKFFMKRTLVWWLIVLALAGFIDWNMTCIGFVSGIFSYETVGSLLIRNYNLLTQKKSLYKLIFAVQCFHSKRTLSPPIVWSGYVVIQPLSLYLHSERAVGSVSGFCLRSGQRQTSIYFSLNFPTWSASQQDIKI